MHRLTYNRRLAAPMWLPTLKAYTGGGRLDQTGLSEYTFSENMPFIQIFSKLFSGANSTNELVVGLPNIFCGILVVALVMCHWYSEGIILCKGPGHALCRLFHLNHPRSVSPRDPETPAKKWG